MRFGNLDGVLAAEPIALLQIDGIEQATITLLKLAQRFLQKTAAVHKDGPVSPSAVSLPTSSTAGTCRQAPPQSASFTRDEDLLAEAAARDRSGRSFAGIIYAHQSQVAIGQGISDLEITRKSVVAKP